MNSALIHGYGDLAAIRASDGLLVVGGALAGVSLYVGLKSLKQRLRARQTVSEPKKRCDEHEGLLAELRRSEERITEFVNRSPLAIIEIDSFDCLKWLEDLKASGVKDLGAYLASHPDDYRRSKGRVTKINQMALRMTGFSSVEDVKTHWGSELSESSWQVQRECLLAMWEERWEAEGKMTFTACDGSIVNVVYRWWLPSSGGRPDASRGQFIMVDISDIMRAECALSEERERRESEQQHTSKLEALALLAGGIAHDFNNQLTVIMGNLTLAMLDTQLSTEANKWLHEAERGVLRTRDLTQQLLTFAKGGNPVRKAVALGDVVRETALFAMHGSKARCNFDIAANLWAANVDKAQITQVVQNLVINATQAMPGGGDLRIELCNETVGPNHQTALQSGCYVRMAVTDSGVGIPRENVAHIFDPYFTTKKHGSGLGLATTYSIVRKHQGHIEVESEVGKGTSFRVWLPALNTAPEAPISSSSAEAKPLGGRVLLMDDDKAIRSFALTLFPRLGYHTMTVSNGSEALKEFERARTIGQPYDAVVLDLTVPGGMGGMETLQRLKAIDPEVRAIVSSGYASDPIMGNYLQHGFCGCVPKPYRTNDLTKALETAIGKKVGENADASSSDADDVVGVA